MELNILDRLNLLPRPWKFLAPMVGNSDEAYRILAKKYGADVCYTEMVNSKVFNLWKSDPVINQWYTTGKDDRPIVVQICGDNPEEMATACKIISKNCDAIDINFGCPQDVAKKGHYGSYLQDEWDLIDAIVRACSNASSVPLFCKIRVFEDVEKTIDYAKMIERAGAKLITVHGRTRAQRGVNTGFASWMHIKAVKDALKIPVIANGNILKNETILECYEITGCDGVMSAEAHLYNPLLFYSGTCKINSIELFSEYLSISKKLYEEKMNSETPAKLKKFLLDLGPIRSHGFKILDGLLKKLPELRVSLARCKNFEEFYSFIEVSQANVENGTLVEEDLKMGPKVRDSKIYGSN